MAALLVLLLLAPEATKLFTGFRFTEGPAANAAGEVFFNDIPNQRCHKIDAKGKLTVFREGTNRANGLFFHGNGELYACEGGAGAVVAYSADGKRRVLADRYEGKPLNSPNDLVIDKGGGVYFTDPVFGRNRPVPQKVHGVYYIAPKGKVTRLVADLPKPNGIHMAPDEKTLYVVCSGKADVMAYAIEKPGVIDKGRVLFTLKQPEGRTNTGGDGLTIDTDGNLYITSRLGIQVVSAKGELIRVLEFPEKPANCAFGGADMKTLYVTARTSVYTMRLEATGHRFPAGK